MPFLSHLRKQREPQKRERARAWTRAQLFSNRFERRFARRFQMVVQNLEDRITEDLVETAAEAQSAEMVIAALPIGLYAPLTKASTRILKQPEDVLPDLSFDEQLDILLATLLAEKAELELGVLLGKLTAGDRSRVADFRFDIVNPHSIAWLRTHRLELIRGIQSNTESAIRDAIKEAIEQGISAPATARRIRDTIGLTAPQQKHLAKVRAQLEAADPPLSRREIENMVAANRRRKLKVRSEAIAQTEITRAESQGQMDMWRSVRDEGLLDAETMKRWVAASTADALCRSLHNAEPVPLDGNFVVSAGEFFAPPAHPRCRCSLVLVFPGDLTAEESAA
jgi:hypothetical protein